MGGVGKTALATVVAHRLKDRHPDAQIYINLHGAGADSEGKHILTPPVTPETAMQRIIHDFHPEAKLPEQIEQLAPIYRSVLTDAGRVLLFLDNAADENQICPLLPPANCLLLVTSRKQFALPGLAQQKIGTLSQEKSEEFLCKLTDRFVVGSTEAKTAAELCGHLPLALEVFAGAVHRQTITPVSELVQRLRDRKQKLGEVDAAFEVGYEGLTAELRKQWTLLAVFPASFDLRAATAIWGKDNAVATDVMQTLVNASLVEYNQGSGRFRLHDLVREFCRSKLTESELAAAQLRHAAHYHDVGAEADELYLRGGDNVVRGLELFDRERGHIESAFEFLSTLVGTHSSSVVSQSVAAKLLLSLINAVVYTGQGLRFHPHQAIRYLEAQRDAARLINNRSQEAQAVGNLGLAHADLGDIRKAIEFYEQQLVIVREIGYRLGEGKALGNLGIAYRQLGDARKCIELSEQSLVIDREIGYRLGEGNSLGNLGNGYANLGDTRKAIEFYEQQLVIAREIGDRRGEGNALGSLGNAYRQLGDARKAIEFYEQHLMIAREIGDRRGEGSDLGNLGIVYYKLGDPRKAIEYFEQQLVIARGIGSRRGEANALANSALALDELNERTQAIARAEEALKIFEVIEDPNASKVRATLVEWQAHK
jgi:tetratricopeptide (TPR) repeat protein